MSHPPRTVVTMARTGAEQEKRRAATAPARGRVLEQPSFDGIAAGPLSHPLHSVATMERTGPAQRECRPMSGAARSGAAASSSLRGGRSSLSHPLSTVSNMERTPDHAPSRTPAGRGVSHPSHSVATMERVGVDESRARPVVCGDGPGGHGQAGGAASGGDVGMGRSGRGSGRPVGAAVALDDGPSGPGVGGLNVPVEALAVMRRDPAGSADVAGLEACLRAVRAVRSWTDAYEAAVLAAAARCDAAREAGAVDTAGWLGRTTGVGRREALARTRTAAGLGELPEVGRALATGRITHGHAQALTRFAAPADVDLSVDPAVDFPDPARDAASRVATAVRDRQEELIAAAETMSADAYRRFLRRWADRAADDDGAGRDAGQRRRRSVTTFDTDDGMRGVRRLLPADRFAFFENELRRLAEMRWRGDHPDADNVPAKELSCPQRNADALVDMARRSRQLGDNNGEPLRSHVDVMVLIDHKTLTDGLHDASRCELDDTTPLSPPRRGACCATQTFSPPSATVRVGNSTWATAAAPPTARSARRSSPGTAPAPHRAATDPTGCARSTTSFPGPTADPPTSTTSPCSAAATTTSTMPTRPAMPVEAAQPVARARPTEAPTPHPTDHPTGEAARRTASATPTRPSERSARPLTPTDPHHRATRRTAARPQAPAGQRQRTTRRTGHRTHRRTGHRTHRRTGHRTHRRTGHRTHRRTGHRTHRRTGHRTHRRRRPARHPPVRAAPHRRSARRGPDRSNSTDRDAHLDNRTKFPPPPSAERATRTPVTAQRFSR